MVHITGIYIWEIYTNVYLSGIRLRRSNNGVGFSGQLDMFTEVLDPSAAGFGGNIWISIRRY